MKSAYTLWLWRHSRLNESTEVKATHTCGAYVSLFQRRRLSKEKVSRVFFPLRFSFLFPRTFCVHWLTHSFIHSFGSFWPLREPLQFRFWLLVYDLNFISFHFQTSNPNSYPHAPTSPERSCVWKFWVIYQIFKVTFGIVTLVFFCVRWKSKRLFSGVTLLQASHSLKTSRILGGVAKLPCVLPSIKVRRNA